MNSIAPFFAFALLAAMPAVAGDKAEPKVVAFNASVRVEVDASGKPVKVEAPADLPEAIRGYIEKRVASWQYEPARENAIPVPAVTFVQVGACAIPVAEGYRLGLDFKGNGPRIAEQYNRLMPPMYPRDAQMGGATGAFKVSYAIQPDGSTKLKSIETLEESSGRYAKSFRSVLTKWAESLRYQPEMVNGRAMATEMAIPVDFTLDYDGTAGWRKRYLDELQARAIASKECVAAGAPEGLMPIATNSPVRITPVPAG